MQPIVSVNTVFLIVFSFSLLDRLFLTYSGTCLLSIF